MNREVTLVDSFLHLLSSHSMSRDLEDKVTWKGTKKDSFTVPTRCHWLWKTYTLLFVS